MKQKEFRTYVRHFKLDEFLSCVGFHTSTCRLITVRFSPDKEHPVCVVVEDGTVETDYDNKGA